MKPSESRPLDKMLLRLLLWHLLLPSLILTLLAVGLIVYARGHNTETQQLLLARSIAHAVDDHLEHARRMLDAVTQVAEMSTPEELIPYMQAIWQAYGHFDALYLLNERDRVTLLVPPDPRYQGADMSPQSFFTQARSQSEVMISQPFTSLRTGLPSVYLACPLSNGDLVVGELGLLGLQETITAEHIEPDQTLIFVTDRSGRLLIHPQSDLVANQTNVGHLKIVQRGLSGPATLRYLADGRPVLGSAASVEQTGWLVVAQTPLLATLSPYLLWAAGDIFLLSPVVWLVVLWMFRRQLKRHVVAPLTQLSQGVNALADGDFSQGAALAANPAAFAEMSVLAQAFSSMATRLHKLIDSLERRVAERTHDLQHRTLQLQVAAKVARDATVAGTTDELLNRAVDLIQDRFGLYHAGIFLVDERGEYAVLKAAIGEAGRKMLEQEYALKVGEMGIVGHVTNTGQPRIASNVGDDAVNFKNPLLPEVRSEMALPLKVNERIIGALDVQSREEAAFDEDAVATLQTVADQLAVAIERTRLFEQIQAALEERLHTVISNAPVILFSLDRSGAFTLVEGKGLAELGIESDDLVGQSVLELTRHAPQVMRNFQHALDGKALTWLAELSGLVFEIQCSPLLSQEGEVIGVIGVATDITERKQAEAERERLLAAEQEQRLVAETLGEVTLALASQISHQAVLDEILHQAQRLVPYRTAHIVLLENSTLRIASWQGYQASEGKNHISRLVQPLNGLPLDAEVIQARKPVVISNTHQDLRWVVFDETSWVKSHISVPICLRDRVLGLLRLDGDAPGEFSPEDAERLEPLANAAAIAIHNAHLYEQVQRHATELEQRVAERTRELAEANKRLQELDQLKSKFVSNVSHELRTPVANIGVYLHLLERQPENYAQYLSILKEQSNRLSDLIEDILSLARLDLGPEKVEFAPTDLNAVVEQVINAQLPRAEAAGLELIFEPGAAIPPVHAERNQLAQVITNLAVNALNYTPSGQVRISTQLVPERSQVRLEVEDTGMGIEPEDMPHLFERFYRGQKVAQSNIPGTGLGLAIAKEIVDLHGGKIEIESQPGKGSNFRVWLMLAEKKQPHPA